MISVDKVDYLKTDHLFTKQQINHDLNLVFFLIDADYERLNWKHHHRLYFLSCCSGGIRIECSVEEMVWNYLSATGGGLYSY